MLGHEGPIPITGRAFASSARSFTVKYQQLYYIIVYYTDGLSIAIT